MYVTIQKIFLRVSMFICFHVYVSNCQVQYGTKHNAICDSLTASDFAIIERVQRRFLSYDHQALNIPKPFHDYSPVLHGLVLSMLADRKVDFNFFTNHSHAYIPKCVTTSEQNSVQTENCFALSYVYGFRTKFGQSKDIMMLKLKIYKQICLKNNTVQQSLIYLLVLYNSLNNVTTQNKGFILILLFIMNSYDIKQSSTENQQNKI
ncbi:hypothetical protein AGLY_002702 [Aphis glycines]|uniref:Transmembrane protein n=1 Tax=Aphis glycines TaxID=307491 RepID=A0A6G0U103_APHGL|nr:hypothetical protein AGLY_002702 [Aphis glycines]